MDRRSFLKRCSLIPFVGSLATVGQSEATESKLTKEMLDTLHHKNVGPFKRCPYTYEQAKVIMMAEWGDKYQENVSIAQMALKRCGGRELINFLEESNLGNDPKVIIEFYYKGKNVMD